jgi:hypothetical protein
VEAGLADVIQLFREAAFDPAEVEALCLAYEKARRLLNDRGQPPIVQEVIAERIISAARRGVLDPGKLCEMALTAVGNKAVFER